MDIDKEQLELENKELKVKVYDLQEENKMLKENFEHLSEMNEGLSASYFNLVEQKFNVGQLVLVNIAGRDVLGVVTEIVTVIDKIDDNEVRRLAYKIGGIIGDIFENEQVTLSPLEIKSCEDIVHNVVDAIYYVRENNLLDWM